MNWLRLRRWIGEHPALSANLVAAVALLGTFLVIDQYDQYQRSHGFHDDWALAILAIATFVIPNAAYAFLIAYIRGRAGLPITERLGLAMALPLGFLVAVIVAGTSISCREPLGSSLLVGLGFGGAFWLPVLVSQGAGLLAGRALTRYMIRRGKWEFTAPVAGADGKVDSYSPAANSPDQDDRQ